MTTTMDVGDRVNVQYLAYAAGVATTATVVLTVTAPDGTSSTPTVTPTAPNIYDASFELTVVGTWSWRWDVSGTVTDIDRGEVYAGDPAPALYASLARLKFTLNIEDLTRDDLLTEKLDSASRSVEKYCDDRRFYLDTTASVRTYSTAGRIVQSHRDGTERLRVDSIGADAAGILVEVGDGTTWTSLTGFETYPDNALARLEAIEWLVALNCEWSRNRRVRVTARWGWPAVPTAVAEATLLQASRLFRRKDSPEGVAGNSDWGLVRVPNLDPDVKAQLAYLHTDFSAA
jgi:hypothetical protein